MPTASISEISFFNKVTIKIEKDEKIILVGPNNSGKSLFLREISRVCEKGRTADCLIIKGLKLAKEGSAGDLMSFLEAEADYINGFYNYRDWKIQKDIIRNWDRHYLQGQLLNGFVKLITADERLSICHQQSSVSPGQQKTKPQHVLYENDELMEKVSSLFRQAFGKDLMIDFKGGSKVPIHVGKSSELEGLIDRVSPQYVKAVRDNPLLDEQGDGMKSFAGILLEAIVRNISITLIDEPEAFLHPPQMRKLGEILASEVIGQLFISTHSSDILRGFLEGTRGNIRILRISRMENESTILEVSKETIRELWEKPELRYSNALEGIFHEQTIICEDDSDCRLFNCIADHLSMQSQEQWLDTAYVPTGGKHGVAKVAKALHATGVPVKAIFDIDFLAERQTVQSTVEAFGGDWLTIEPLWKRLDADIRGGIKPPSEQKIKSDIIKILNESEEDTLPRGKIQAALKQNKPWNILKKYGIAGLPSGDAQTIYNNLVEKLENIGIYLVPVGEIENFCKEIGVHGPKFVTRLLSTIPLDDEKLSDLRDFIAKVHRGPYNKPPTPDKEPATTLKQPETEEH
ncbi:ATP-dependent nuclease [Microbulbifer sp. JMSA004]|uniref:ATP-dependent nuclease n=1 Tax=Microbulbifer sp. JMSA004 TaxID=3243370 RepID=UPI004039F76E